MVDEIIREVNACLDNGCCIAGLSLALTLPDICGKAYYPKSKNKSRYVTWFDENIGQCEHDEEDEQIGMPYLSGELVYSLRCALLHEGNPNIDGNKFGIVYFELVYRQNEGANIICGLSQAEIIKDENGNDKAIDKQYTVNVRFLCQKICRVAEECYKKDKEKFNFFNYNLVDTDYHTRKIFRMQ